MSVFSGPERQNSLQVCWVLPANPALCSCLQGSVLPPGMDHPIPLQPASMMGPLTQQLGHLSLSSPGTVKRYF